MTATNMWNEIVIDADVARSAGNIDSTEQQARCCFLFLEAHWKICTTRAKVKRQKVPKLVLTDTIRKEWYDNASQFALNYLQIMISKMFINDLRDLGNTQIANAIIENTPIIEECKEIAKDVKLVEAALASGRIVISREVRARECFNMIAQLLQD